MLLTRSSMRAGLRASLYLGRGKIQNSPYGRRGRYALNVKFVKYKRVIQFGTLWDTLGRAEFQLCLVGLRGRDFLTRAASKRESIAWIFLSDA